MDNYAVLKKRTVYDHTNGSQYKCLDVLEEGTLLERISDGWTLMAHGTRMTEDGQIHWNYSTGGHWPNGRPRGYKNGN